MAIKEFEYSLTDEIMNIETAPEIHRIVLLVAVYNI